MPILRRQNASAGRSSTRQVRGGYRAADWMRLPASRPAVPPCRRIGPVGRWLRRVGCGRVAGRSQALQRDVEWDPGGAELADQQRDAAAGEAAAERGDGDRRHRLAAAGDAAGQAVFGGCWLAGGVGLGWSAVRVAIQAKAAAKTAPMSGEHELAGGGGERGDVAAAGQYQQGGGGQGDGGDVAGGGAGGGAVGVDLAAHGDFGVDGGGEAVQDAGEATAAAVGGQDQRGDDQVAGRVVEVVGERAEGVGGGLAGAEPAGEPADVGGDRFRGVVGGGLDGLFQPGAGGQDAGQAAGPVSQRRQPIQPAGCLAAAAQQPRQQGDGQQRSSRRGPASRSRPSTSSGTAISAAPCCQDRPRSHADQSAAACWVDALDQQAAPAGDGQQEAKAGECAAGRRRAVVSPPIASLPTRRSVVAGWCPSSRRSG